MGTFVEHYPINAVIPAEYNPRRLSEQAFTLLRASVRSLGLIRPIIVTDAGRLIAGHQRTRSMKAEGIDHAPAYVMAEVGETDEIRFNQIHNASDVEFGEQILRLPAFDQAERYIEVDSSLIDGELSGRMAAKRNEILRLLAQHGSFSSAVALQSGEIIIGKQYAVCCRTVGIPLMVYVLPDELRETAIYYFDQTYGVFSYDHLPRTTWGQTLAQMYRLRDGAKENRSSLYENTVLPALSLGERILDFGAGQMDYVRRLQRRGHRIRGVEFYYRTGNQINVSQVHRDIDALCRDLEEHGLYDVVVCDSVLNSVDSLQAELDVLICLNAFCRPGGRIYFSGRSRAWTEYHENQLFAFRNTRKRMTHFLDEDGFTAIYSRGVWRYQKMHTYDQLVALCDRTMIEGYEILDKDGRAVTGSKQPLLHSPTWQVRTLKRVSLSLPECEASLAREFNLPLPHGTSYGRSDDIIRAWHSAVDPR